MASEVARVLNEALALTPAQRALIAHSLISSIDVQPEQGAEDAWLELANKRLAVLDSGKVEPVTWASMKERLRKP